MAQIGRGMNGEKEEKKNELVGIPRHLYDKISLLRYSDVLVREAIVREIYAEARTPDVYEEEKKKKKKEEGVGGAREGGDRVIPPERIGDAYRLMSEEIRQWGEDLSTTLLLSEFLKLGIPEYEIEGRHKEDAQSECEDDTVEEPPLLLHTRKLAEDAKSRAEKDTSLAAATEAWRIAASMREMPKDEEEMIREEAVPKGAYTMGGTSEGPEQADRPPPLGDREYPYGDRLESKMRTNAGNSTPNAPSNTASWAPTQKVVSYTAGGGVGAMLSVILNYHFPGMPPEVAAAYTGLLILAIGFAAAWANTEKEGS